MLSSLDLTGRQKISFPRLWNIRLELVTMTECYLILPQTVPKISLSDSVVVFYRICLF